MEKQSISIKIKFVFLITCCCLILTPGKGQTIYVSPTGNNHNSGTKENPVSSPIVALEKVRELRANRTLTHPVEIRLAAGTYRLSTPILLTQKDAGTATSPLIIQGPKGFPAILTGGKQLPPFKKISDHLWEADISHLAKEDQHFEQLYVNGKRATLARTLNAVSFYKVKNVVETMITSGKDSGLARIKVTIYPKDMEWMKAIMPNEMKQAMITFFHHWDFTRKHFTLSINDTALYFTGKKMASWNPINSQSIYKVENARAFLNEQGEWYPDPSGKLFYVPRKGESIANTTAIAPIANKLLILQGNADSAVQYIHFKNIIFSEAGYIMPESGNEPAQAAVSADAAIVAEHAAHITFTNCEIRHTGNYACWIKNDCHFFTLSHCYLHDLGAGGVKIGVTAIPKDSQQLTSHITLDNNIIRSGGYVYPTGTGVLILNASDNTITHNEIADFRYTGISVGWVWGYSYSPTKRNNISYNHIHHFGWGILSDMGAVYTLGASEGTTVSNNVIHDVFSREYGGWGLYTDEGSSGITMENNLVYHCKSAAFHQHYGKDNVISNNIFVSQVKAQLQATRVEPHLSFTFSHNIIYFDSGILMTSSWNKVEMKSDYNCYWDTRTKDVLFGKESFKVWQQSGKDVHSIIADPMFKNPEKHDFHIQNKAVLKAIHFKPFDYNKAGVYGDKSWKQLARFDGQIAKEFDSVVKRNSD